MNNTKELKGMDAFEFIQQGKRNTEFIMQKLDLVERRYVFGKELRIFGTCIDPLFAATDVAEWIEYDDYKSMIANVDDDEKITIKIPGSDFFFFLPLNIECIFLTEYGLYQALILIQNNKPIAKQWKKKVREILREIRSQNKYMSSKTRY